MRVYHAKQANPQGPSSLEATCQQPRGWQMAKPTGWCWPTAARRLHCRNMAFGWVGGGVGTPAVGLEGLTLDSCSRGGIGKGSPKRSLSPFSSLPRPNAQLARIHSNGWCPVSPLVQFKYKRTLPGVIRSHKSLGLPPTPKP